MDPICSLQCLCHMQRSLPALAAVSPGFLAALGVDNEQLQTSLLPHYSQGLLGVLLLSMMSQSKSQLAHCWTQVDF